jgi:hypothetical protein
VHGYGAVIIAVGAIGAAVGVMQPPIHQIIHVIAMRHGFVAAAWPVHMRALGGGVAAIGIGGTDRDHMFVHMIAVRMVQMAIVEIISVAIMADRRVATAWAVNMIVAGMNSAAHEVTSLLACCGGMLDPTLCTAYPRAGAAFSEFASMQALDTIQYITLATRHPTPRHKNRLDHGPFVPCRLPSGLGRAGARC